MNGRRFFLPIGMDRPGGVLRDLARVGADVATMTRLFSGLGYRRVRLPRNLTAKALHSQLDRWLDRTVPGQEDALVVYYTGHGCVAEGDHYLCPTGFDRDRLAATAFKTQGLIELFTRRRARPGKLWIVLDCCQAGGVLCDGLYGAMGGQATATFLLAASGSWGQVVDGTFAEALQNAVAAASGATPPATASLDQLTQAINERWSGPRAIQASVSSLRFDFLD